MTTTKRFEGGPIDDIAKGENPTTGLKTALTRVVKKQGENALEQKGYTPLIGKKPTRMDWPNNPMTTEEIEDHLGNVGVITGKTSGIYVVDLDNVDEIPSRYPMTWTVRTGRGYHLYYRHVAGLRNTRNRLGDGVDTRGDGGQVVAVGSLHENGTTYHWVAGRSPDDIPLGDMSAWIIESLQ